MPPHFLSLTACSPVEPGIGKKALANKAATDRDGSAGIMEEQGGARGARMKMKNTQRSGEPAKAEAR